MALGSDPAVSDPAWHTVTALLEYRSFLNEPHAPSNRDAVGVSMTPSSTVNQISAGRIDWHIDLPTKGRPENLGKEYLVQGGTPVSSGAAALLQSMDNHSNDNAALGFSYIFVSSVGGRISLTLDNQTWRNVVVRNVNIIYDGGPTNLQNVYFVDCTFEVRKTPDGEKFAVNLLSHVPLSFGS